jgi:RHS repeat-associated protein
LVTDANGNRTEVLYDAIGMVAATAVMGKVGENLGDSVAGTQADLTDAQLDAVLSAADPVAAARPLLGTASSRAISDPRRFSRTVAAHPADIDKWIPAYTATVSRVTHASEPQPPGGSRLQIAFSYSDGFGREVQRKALSPPDRATPGVPRWTTSGWTIRNNKNLAVRTYEPFFHPSHTFTFGRREGVSVVRLYDPVGRVIAVLHPDHAWEKTVDEPWRQLRFDAADTVHPVQRYDLGQPAVLPPDDFDPSDDEDVGAHFARLPPAEYLPTWYGRMNAANASLRERAAAQKSARHAGTPAVTDNDALGRGFRAVSDNGDDPAGSPRLLITRTELDIEGNVRSSRDAKPGAGAPLGRLVKTCDYSMLGAVATHAHMDAGRRWALADVGGQEHRAWDDRGHEIATFYDALRRPLRRVVRGSDALQSDPRTLGVDVEFEDIEYGEGVAGAAASNLRTRVHRARDPAGVIVNASFDFKGNLAEYSRAIVTDFEALPDWSGAVATDAALTSEAVYDALNRAIRETTPDGSTIRRTYNVASQLESVDVNVRAEAKATPVILATDYDAKGRRTRIELGARASPGGEPVTTEYEYDLPTARLARIVTRRDRQDFPGDCPQRPPAGWPGCRIQSLSYTYDAVGNVTHVRDDAQQRIFFANRRVEPSCEYTYDALYRLIGATGREHIGQPGAGAAPSYSDSPWARIPHPADGTAVANYTETYAYDDAGNLTAVNHGGTDPRAPGYTRKFRYEEASPLGLGGSNRLTGCLLGGGASKEPFSTAGDGYDRHGNLLHMPHLQVMAWDFRDRLRTTQRQATRPGDADGIAAAGERTFHVYGADGRRVRKATRRAGGGLKDERIYVGIYERYRRTGVNAVERETLRIGDGAQTVALIETRVAGNELGMPARMVRFQIGNNLGSAALEFGADAAVISYEEYTPYGGTSYQGVASQTDAPKRYRFCGKERDEETGLYHFGARYYAPWLARWISCDSEDASNRYLYVSGNPVSLVDPDGRNGGPPPIVTGSYGGAGGIGGDHVHQVAAMTQSTAAGRSSAPLYNKALSVSTSQNPWYANLNGQRVEQAINRSMWGRDYSGTPAPNGRVTVVSTGNTTVGSSTAATASPWFEDIKSLFKLYEAGVDPEAAADLVSASRDHLDQGGASAARVPQGPRSAPAALKAGQNVSVQQPVRLSGQSAGGGGSPAASTATTATADAGGSSTAASATTAAEDALSVVDDIKPAAGAAAETVGLGGKILKGLGAGAAVLGSLVGGIQVGTGIVQIQEGEGAEGAVTITEGGANLALTIGGAALVKAKVVTMATGATGGAATVGAGVLAAGGIALAAEEWRRAIRGEKSAAREAAEYWADVAVAGDGQGGFAGAAKQASGWTFGFFATLIAVGQGQGPR